MQQIAVVLPQAFRHRAFGVALQIAWDLRCEARVGSLIGTIEVCGCNGRISSESIMSLPCVSALLEDAVAKELS